MSSARPTRLLHDPRNGDPLATVAAGSVSAAKANPRAVLEAGPCVPSDQRLVTYGWAEVRGVSRVSLYWDYGGPFGEVEYERFEYGRKAAPSSLTAEHQYNTTQASTFRVEVYVRGKLAYGAGPLTPPVESC